MGVELGAADSSQRVRGVRAFEVLVIPSSGLEALAEGQTSIQGRRAVGTLLGALTLRNG